MADAIHGNTELGATKEDLIAQSVQRSLAAQANLTGLVMDVSRFALPGYKSISFPKLGEFTAVDRASATAGDATVITSTVDQLDLDHCAYVAWIVDHCDQVQSRISIQTELAARAATAHARKIDADLIAEMELAGVATTTAGAISKDIFLEMREGLLTRGGDLSRMHFVCGPGSETLLLKIADFVRSDAYGVSSIPTGRLGRLYGVDVTVNRQLGANTFYMLDEEGLAFGLQSSPSFSEQGANEHGSMAKRAVLDQLYGVKAMQIGVQGVGVAESALIVKDNN